MRFKVNPDNITSILEVYLMRDDPLTQTDEQNVAEILSEKCAIDLSIWQITDITITSNIWTVHGKFGSAIKENQQWSEARNRQLKVQIRYKRIAPDNKSDFYNELLAELSRKSPKREAFKSPLTNGAAMLVDLPDRHLGRLSYGKETGSNYDIKIAVDRSMRSIDYFLDEAKYANKRNPIEKIIYPLGNDFFNYNHAKPFPQTSNGTPQESDVRFQKMFFVGSSLEIKQIEASANIAPVEVFVIPGNHDEELAFYLGQVIHAWFRNNKRVTVNISPTPRKYYQHGKNLLGFDHGQWPTFERLFSNMVFESEEMWHNTLFKYFYTGHAHHKEVKAKLVKVEEDLNGILFDRLASLSSRDYYETIKGFISIKMAEAFLFDKELGKRYSFCYQLPLPMQSDN